MEPKIELKSFNLISIKEKIDFEHDTDSILKGLQTKFLEEINKVVKSDKIRYMAYWYYEQNSTNKELYDCCYLACVEKKYVHNVPENFENIVLPKSLYAIFSEERRGTVGGPDGYAYNTWLPDSGYSHNTEINGDLEIYKDLANIGADDECEILIPIR